MRRTVFIIFLPQQHRNRIARECHSIAVHGERVARGSLLFSVTHSQRSERRYFEETIPLFFTHRSYVQVLTTKNDSGKNKNDSCAFRCPLESDECSRDGTKALRRDTFVTSRFLSWREPQHLLGRTSRTVHETLPPLLQR